MFFRMDGDNIMQRIPAHVEHTGTGQLRSQLCMDGLSIETVEHLLAALVAKGISNVAVHAWGSELPTHDGSAAPWGFLIECAGIKQQSCTKKAIRIDRKVRVGDRHSWCELVPYDGTSYTYEGFYDHPMLGQQHHTYDAENDDFDREIAPARTFGFIKDLEKLLAAGLGQGATKDNTIVFDDMGLISNHALRWPNEPARHKVCDAIGDLALIGAPIQGAFRGFRSGHALNHQLVRAVLSDRQNWSYVPMGN